MKPSPFGLLLVDKPSGPTSHQVVAYVRRWTGERQIGHTGTLDPLASGLMVLCLGPATRLSAELTGKPKRYTAQVHLGQVSTTYDAEGDLTPTGAPVPTVDEVSAALLAFVGDQLQTPPAFSAVRQGGQRAYDLARKGHTVTLPPRPVTIFSLTLTAWQPPLCELDVRCSAGTYIRSLAHDLGHKLGCGAHLAGLRRTESGHFALAQAHPLDDVRAHWEAYLLTADHALPDWPTIHLTATEAERVRRGQPARLTPHAERARAFDEAGRFFALLRARDGAWWPDKVLA